MPLARVVNGDIYYYLYNSHGDVVQFTYSFGNIIYRYTYDEFGNQFFKKVNMFEIIYSGNSRVVRTTRPDNGENIVAIKLDEDCMVPFAFSQIMNLKKDKSYIIEFDYWSDSGDVPFNCDLHPDDLPEIHPIAKPVIQHYKWETSSNSTNMKGAMLRFFNDLSIPNPDNIYITNIKLYRTKAVKNDLTYFGQIYDDESKNYYLSSRYYDPSTKRFLSRDTYEGKLESPMSLNSYAYCQNNPLKYVDVNGHFPAFLIPLGYAYLTMLMTSPDIHSDAMMFADSLATFQDNKTILNGVSVAADGIALAIPIIVAGSGKAIRSTEKLLDAFGGAAKGMVKTGADNVADFEKLKATLAADEILDANRVGTALSKSDAAHRSASFLTKEQLAAGKVYNLRGGDGIQRSLLQVSGEMNGNKGIFEYILTPEGDISHQLFIKGGKYTGYPNQVVPKGGW